MTGAVFLDRDGTINLNKDGHVHKIVDFEFAPFVIDGLKVLMDINMPKIVITNQSGIARGMYTETDLHKLMKFMFDALAKHQANCLEKTYYFCPHHPTEGILSEYKMDCSCRKPKDGLFKRAIDDFVLDPKKCYSIGNKWGDIEPIIKLGGKGILIKTDGKEFDKFPVTENERFVKADNLLQAALLIKNGF
jgi:D-glycero-D-manno-heptose 1,7-bisphosphate phosphatase